MKIRLRRPVSKTFPISSPFGTRVIRGKPEFHKGVDFAVPVGVPVLASVDGTVIRSGWENPHEPKQGYGLRVMQQVLIDGVAYFLWYAHLNKVVVFDGQKIKAGEVVGHSGNTGRTTGPHLHLGIRQMDTKDFFDMEFFDSEEKKAVA